MPGMPCDCPRHEEICVEFEQSLEPCPCGGVFQKKFASALPTVQAPFVSPNCLSIHRVKCTGLEKRLAVAS